MEEPAFQVSFGCLIYHWQLAGSIDVQNVISFRSCQSVRPYLLGSWKTQNMCKRRGRQGKGCIRLQELVLPAPRKRPSSASLISRRYLVFVVLLVAKSCLTLRPHGLWSARLLCPWDFPGKNIGVGSHFLLQGSSLPRCLYCRQIGTKRFS